MLRDLTRLRTLKNLLRLSAFALYGFLGATFADDFKSAVVSSTGLNVRVHDDQFMLIRNFTQDTTQATRGMVMVSKPPSAAAINVLAAAVLDTTPVEVINSVVIAGPADVTVTCDPNATCFISYKKDSN